MCWAAGSLLAGVVTGTIAWRASPARRFRIGSLALALSLVPLPFVDQPIVMAGLLAISGMAIAPTLIASVAVTQGAVLPNRLTEALGWTSTGLASGVAAGAAVVGQLIDYSGSTAGFWGVVGFGLLLIITAVFVRSPVRRWPDGPSAQRREILRSWTRPSVGRKPVALILSRLSTLCCGRGARVLPSPYAAVVTLDTAAGSAPRAANTSRAMAAQVIGSPPLLTL